MQTLERSQLSHLGRTLLVLLLLGLASCASTDIIDSPKTGFVPDSAPTKEPVLVWTSRTFNQNFDYLAQMKVRSWTYEGAVDRLVEAAKTLKADAVIDIHYEQIGFLNAMQAFAIKYK